MTTDGKTAHGRQVERVLWIVLVLNLVVAASKYFYGLASGSASMQADGIHSVFDSLGNVIGLADPIMALLVTVAILASAVGVFRTGLRTLSDHARIPAADIARAAEKVDGVRSIHAVRTRGTEAEVYCDLHVLVDPQMTVLAAHDLGDKVEGVVAAAFPQIKEVLVHIEPDTAAERAEG